MISRWVYVVGDEGKISLNDCNWPQFDDDWSHFSSSTSILNEQKTIFIFQSHKNHNFLKFFFALKNKKQTFHEGFTDKHSIVQSLWWELWKHRKRNLVTHLKQF